MNGSLLADAFGHHAWATITLIDACSALTPEQLESPVPGTYGSIRDTLAHLVGADRSYLRVISGEDPEQDEDPTTLEEMRSVMVENGPRWQALLRRDMDPDAIVTRGRPDGSTSSAPLTIRLAQVVHHGTDHRSQVCTAFTLLGIEPPLIDAWDYAEQDGRLSETEPTTAAAE